MSTYWGNGEYVNHCKTYQWLCKAAYVTQPYINILCPHKQRSNGKTGSKPNVPNVCGLAHVISVPMSHVASSMTCMCNTDQKTEDLQHIICKLGKFPNKSLPTKEQN